MKTRSRRERPTLFSGQKVSSLNTPGEYGKRAKPEGWVVVTIPELEDLTIYLASETFSKKLSAHFNIPSANIVNLICRAPLSKRGIPEEILSGPKGLGMFRERLEKIHNCKQPVLIHCKAGLNRTPVAAVIYLIDRGIDAEKAVKIITDAYVKQRDPKFVLNKRGHYTLVLEQANHLTQPAKQPPQRKECRSAQ
jgi:protein tyrosine/serine phosphatase